MSIEAHQKVTASHLVQTSRTGMRSRWSRRARSTWRRPDRRPPAMPTTWRDYAPQRGWTPAPVVTGSR